MPKNVWDTKKRKRTRKKKTADSAQDAEIIERSRMPDPNDPTISIGMISDLSLNTRLKQEEVMYPDTRFQSSTALFPAVGVEEKYVPSETSCETYKRVAEDELISTMPKKRKEDDIPKKRSTDYDDCEIVENPKKRVKIEVVDLTDDSHPIVSLLCSPVKTGFLENRLPSKPNTDFQANGNVRVKVESRENTNEINTNAVVSAGMNYQTNMANIEQNTSEIRLPSKPNTDLQANGNVRVKVESMKNTNEINTNTVVSAGMNHHTNTADIEQNTSEKNNEVNTDKSCLTVNKNADLLGKNIPLIQVKTEKSAPCESVNSDEAFIEHSSENRIKIKTEKNISSENNTEGNLENNHVAASKGADSMTHNIPLRSEVEKENVDGRSSVDNISRFQVKAEKIVASESVNSDESSIKDSSENRIIIKTEKNILTESNTEASLGNYPIAANKRADSATHNISLKSKLDKENINRGINITMKDKQKGNCVVDGNIPLLNFPSGRPIKSEQNKTNKNCEVGDNYTPVPKPLTQVKSEPETDFQNAHSGENPQNNEEISQKITNSNNRNANSRIFSDDKQLHQPGTIRTLLLKYMCCNKKVEVREISDALSLLNNLYNHYESQYRDYNE